MKCQDADDCDCSKYDVAQKIAFCLLINVCDAKHTYIHTPPM